jgi:hypothetical protein
MVHDPIQSLDARHLKKNAQRAPHAIQKQASAFLLVLKSLQNLAVAVAVAVA